MTIDRPWFLGGSEDIVITPPDGGGKGKGKGGKGGSNWPGGSSWGKGGKKAAWPFGSDPLWADVAWMFDFGAGDQQDAVSASSAITDQVTGNPSSTATHVIVESGGARYVQKIGETSMVFSPATITPPADGASFTFEMWANFRGEGLTSTNRAIRKQGFGVDDNDWSLSRIDTSGTVPHQLQGGYFTPPGQWSVDGPNFFTSAGREAYALYDDWIHYCLQYNGSQYRFYTSLPGTENGKVNFSSGTGITAHHSTQPIDITMKGHIRAARLTYNQVRYTFAGAFTPDTNFGKE